MKFERSLELFDAANRVIPGGVNSPVRSFGSVGGVPRFMTQGSGARLTDADGNSYIDYVLSWGPLILGHAHPDVVDALVAQVRRGTSYGTPTEMEVRLAELIREAVPSIEMVRLVNSGTEACMSALRLARAFTGRESILKFEGCYHGHADDLLVQAGSGAAFLSQPTSAGVTQAAAQRTLVAPFNDLEAVEALFKTHGEEVAAIIVEPVAGNMGLVFPEAGYLDGLRRITNEYSSLLIFDEVLSGFRASHGGAQERYGVLPDITCLGKVIGGGLPVGAYGGRKEIMEMVAPLGPMYQAGTLSGNPLAVAAGIATLEVLRDESTYAVLERRTKQLCDGLVEAASKVEVAVQVVHGGSLWGMFFSDEPVRDYATAKGARGDVYGRFFHSMLDSGVYLAPSPMETGFLSTAHTEDDVEATLGAARKALGEIAATA